MQIAVLPINQTELAWGPFQSLVTAAIKRSPTAALDRKSVTERNMASAIVSFAEFEAEGTDYIATLRDAGSVLRHFMVSFLTMCDSTQLLFDIATEGDLRILTCDDNEKLSIISATLEQWRTSIINFASHRATSSHRQFAEAVLQAFDRMKLGRIWENYTRVSSNQSFLLVEKR